MRRMVWLAGLMLAAASTSALASAPSYDYLQIDYVGTKPKDDGLKSQGADFQISALIAPYLIFDASYQYLQSETFGLRDDRIDGQTVTAGLAGRIPMVRNFLEGTIGADYVYADAKHRDDAGGDDLYGNGYQVKGTLRGNFRYFEAIPSVRYIDVLDTEQVGFGLQLLGCPGYGLCLTGGYEYLKGTGDNGDLHRWFAGLRFYYD